MTSTDLTRAERNRQSMEVAFDAFNRYDLEAVRSTAAEDYVDHEAPEELGDGFDATKRNVERFIQAFPDIHWEVLDLVTDERCGAARLRVTGTHRGMFMGIEPTQRRVDFEGVDFLRFDADGQVREHWGYMDKTQLLAQLGAVPETVPGGS